MMPNISMTGARSFNSIRDLVGIDHMLFGTDHPFGPISGITSSLDRLGLSDSDAMKLYRGNAIDLLPRFASGVSSS